MPVNVGTSWGAPPELHDNPLNPSYVGETTVQSRHITELRDAINSLRTHLGTAAFSWQHAAAPGDWIKADPILEMRTALDQALGAPPSPGYGTGLAQGLPIKALHIQELRDRVLAAWNSGSSSQMNWLVTDQLGTPRMIIDQSGSLAGVSRHDYLPFGEELPGTVGLRPLVAGYAINDGTRQKFTSKERDDETNLDYFGARYYSSYQGRFTAADIAGSVLVNPQTLNKYAYALNNPLRYIDRNGFYEEDVHRDLTVALAYAAGFSMKDAEIIGRENQRVDTDERSPYAGIKQRALWHFTTPERRDDLWSDFEWRATTQNSDYAYWGALQHLGAYFHPQQDSFSHDCDGCGPIMGHIHLGHAPDQTFNDVPKADRMARDTFDRLVSALDALSKRFGGHVSNHRIPWNDTLSGYVNKFNAARDKSQKKAILQQLIFYVNEQRHWVKWAEDFEKKNGPPPKMPKKK